MLIIVIFGYRTAKDTANMLNKSLNEDVIPLVEVIQLQEQTNKIRVLEGELVQKNDIFNVLGIINQISNDTQKLSNDLQAFLGDHFAEEQELRTRLLNLYENYKEQVEKTTIAAEKNNLGEAVENFRFSSSPRYLLFIESLESLSVIVKNRAEKKHQRLSEELRSKRNIYLGLSVFFIFTGFIIFFSLARSLTSRIAKLRRGALAFSSGNFSDTLHISGKDEVSDLAEAFNIMRNSLQQKIEQLSELNDRISQQNRELEKHRVHLEELVEEKTSDLIQSEELLQHFQKMDSLGTLAGGIAHDFNNLMHGIAGYAHLLQLEKMEPEKSRHYLQQIELITSRGAELVKRIMAFSRREPTQLDTYSLNTIIEETVNLLKRTVPKEIELKLNLPEEPVYVAVDHSQLEQVLINIANNGVDAITGAGSLMFSLTIENINELEPITAGEYAVVAITDSGAGMEESVRSRIFDPFFTTKDIGKGTGLGLSSAYGIIKNFGGFISCESQQGVGSTFLVTLPVCRKEALKPSTMPSMSDSAPGGGKETILIIDDESSIREVAREFLLEKGYTVLATENGRSALALLQAHKGQVDLIVMDIGMPGMSGNELLSRLQNASPESLVVVCSGYLDHDFFQTPELYNLAATLTKPFTPAALLDTIRTVLDNQDNANGF